ncbi:MAG: protein translocase subunit SecF [Bacillota bacterium]|nr:protein translocase subunit SecF [Bacillota bacterium]
MKYNFNIIPRRKNFYYVSVVVIVLGLALLMFRGLNLGIDFRSGTIIEVDLKTEYTTARVREVVAPILERLQVRDIREAGQQTTMVQIRTTEVDDADVSKALVALRTEWPEAKLSFTSSVDATFSSELVRNAIFALILASIGMLIYIAIRFEYKFAVAAVLALLHDVLIVLAFFALLRIEVNSEFVAAILTIVGYSINDTIVVFDRIRENMNKAKRQTDLEGLVNRSINETLVRSINTSITTLLAIGAVLIFGGVTLRPLAIALVVGILAGTYSSIFIASSVWVDWKESELGRRINTKKA